MKPLMRLWMSLPVAWGLFEDRFAAWQLRAKETPQVRPRYVGVTDSAATRRATQLELLRAWPGGEVKELASVVGGMAVLDLIQKLRQRHVRVRRLKLFDVNEQQLEFGELILELLRLNDREGLVQALYGRKMRDLGRVLCLANMMDFLDLPINQESFRQTSQQLPAHLRGLYKQVFESLSGPKGWPVAWPCFGQRSSLPRRPGLSRAQRRLGGARNEALHINEAGWLESERSFEEAKTAVLELEEIEFKRMNLQDLETSGDNRVVYISNIDGSPQFLAENALSEWRREAKGTLLLSTRRAEWLD